MNKPTLTTLLNLKCSKTGKVIEAGEVVRLFDWGTETRLLGYGSFVWDEQYRKFNLVHNEFMNSCNGLKSAEIDDYDMFRTMPEKLTDGEQRLLNK